MGGGGSSLPESGLDFVYLLPILGIFYLISDLCEFYLSTGVSTENSNDELTDHFQELFDLYGRESGEASLMAC